MRSWERTLEQLCVHLRETALLESIRSVLQWDERTMMPAAGGEYRAESLTWLAGSIHRRQTDPRLEDWLVELEASPLANDPHGDAGATIREVRREYDRQTRLPQLLVEQLARTTVRGEQAWVEARANDSFAMLLPWLKEIFRLKRQQAEALGYRQSPYDALLEGFEPGASTTEVATVLEQLRSELVPLVRAIQDSGRQAPRGILQRRFPRDAQERFGRFVAAAIGFDFARGRLDVTAHPFCSSLGPHDCRITTRYDEHFFPSAFFGILHEAGHGIYDQGLRPDQYGLAPGSALSLGIHESQSRLWENQVGRGRAFWQHFLPLAAREFPEALNDVSLDDFCFAINAVNPSLIRVEADEATYNLHIVIRFELEQALITGDLTVEDLPAAWNERYRRNLGIQPDSDRDGVLQDIHWSAGLIGYFPTYSLGNLYAAQFFAQVDEDLGGIEPQLARGQFGPLREWLRERIHQVGRCYSADQLVEKVTGGGLSQRCLMSYLHRRLDPLYGLG